MSARGGALALLATAALLAGCGSDSGEQGSASTQTASGQDGRERVIVESSGGAFDPSAIFDSDAPGVVTVETILSEGGALGDRAAGGSGFVISDKGEIVTNAHVVSEGEGEDIKPGKEVFVSFADTNRVPAKIVGLDPNSDIALLKVDPEGLDLQPLELSEDAELRPGQPVAAIGSPLGREQSLSVGVISATGRSVQSLTAFQIGDAIQTDAAINQGNSGGPLLDADGKVIGVNQQIESTSGGGDGVGFAVPVSAVRRSTSELRKSGSVEYAFIGVSTQPLYPQLAERLDIDAETGALVAEVSDDGPAAKAGIKGGTREITFQGIPVSAGGDLILKVDGVELTQATDLGKAIADNRPGDKVEVELLRDDDRETVEITLKRRPSELLNE